MKSQKIPHPLKQTFILFDMNAIIENIYNSDIKNTISGKATSCVLNLNVPTLVHLMSSE